MKIRVFYRCYFGFHKWIYAVEDIPHPITVRECVICNKKQRATGMFKDEWIDMNIHYKEKRNK